MWELKGRDHLVFGAVGPMITEAVQRVGPPTRWAGAGRLPDFIERYLHDFDVSPEQQELRAPRSLWRRILGL